MDCVDLDKLGGAAPAPKWLAANDNGLTPARLRRRSRAKLELLK